ncbi:replication-associated protein [Sagusvirus crownis]|uniref:Replication-associated protein n=1 Tax=Circovirus sp. TaxID=1964372 RepID=A0A2K9YNB5_9CIRC|nr:replication-associated protein [Circovirus sp.]
MTRYKQGVYWLLTIPQHQFVPYLPDGVVYVYGQLERGANTGYLHWQLLVCFARRVRLRSVKAVFGEDIHAELSRSSAAREYCGKQDTRVEGTSFELGDLPVDRAQEKDWDKVWGWAVTGEYLKIPADIRVRCYSTIRKIEKDHMQAIEIPDKIINVYWGASGTGKSRRAWDESGPDAYPKDPNTKFWDGYCGQASVVVDEFKGRVDLSHILRWCDRYPVCVENKGGGVVCRARRITFTSNVDWRRWWPDATEEELRAFRRRCTSIVHFERSEGVGRMDQGARGVYGEDEGYVAE